MKFTNQIRALLIAGFALATLAGMSPRAHAQDTQPPRPPEGGQQANQIDQMLGPLNLTQEQVRRIRMINAELKDERQAANFRLRMAQRSLAEAIQSPTPDETLIAQRSKEVADAQANTIRLRSLTEVRVLQVLTPEQRIRLREMRARNQQMRRNGNQQLPRILGRQQNGLQRNSNDNTTPTPRQQRKLMRQQQQTKP